MTREEAIFILKRDNPNNIAIRTGFENLYDQRKEAFSMAIKALEEESILDKIRTEISEYGSIWVEYKITGRRDKDIEQLVTDVLKQAKKQVLDVIDKYRGESEDT